MAINNEQNKLNVPHLRFPEFHGEWEKCKLGVYTNLKVYHFLIKKCTTPNRLQRYA